MALIQDFCLKNEVCRVKQQKLPQKWVSVDTQVAESKFLICMLYPLLDNGITQMVSVALVTKLSWLQNLATSN